MIRTLIAALLLLAAVPARAADTPVVTTPHTTARLMAAGGTKEAGKPVTLALRLTLAPGWHTYWSNPGDAGNPPTLDATLSSGHAGPLQFPTPQRLRGGPLVAYGYTGDVVLPFAVEGARTGEALRVEANASWLACASVCVPEQALLSLTIPPESSPGRAAEAALIDDARARLPRPSPFTTRIAPDGALTVTGPGIEAVRDAWFFPAEPDRIDQDGAQTVSLDGRTLTVSLPLAKGAAPKPPLDGVLVLHDQSGQDSAFQVNAEAGTVAPARAGLGEALLLALVGGLLLNLMPCVFPILAMKAVGIARLSGRHRQEIQRQGLAYAAGVILSFASLGLMLVALRAAGQSIGWGFQFQSPLFVALTSYVLFAVGLNLAGLFEVNLDASALGGRLSAHTGLAGSFATGCLAVVVATPCTAPFMGAALAAALASPAWRALAIFAGLGCGLAAPYLLLAASPGLARLMPRPGAWMARLRQALAFPMFAACAWLLSVASAQGGGALVLAIGGGFVLLGLAAWLAGLRQSASASPGARRRLAWAALVAVGLALALVPTGATLGAGAAGLGATPGGPPGAEAFSAARLAALRDAGKPVFVDLTAAWCITCLVNERVALSRQAVLDAMAARHVTYMKGDWTLRSKEIADYLGSQGRDGVPLYVLYPSGGAPVTLPQVLTEGVVLAALARVGG